MRTLIALVFCFLLASPQVYACRDDGETLFFDTIPNPPPDADVIAKISLSDVKNDQGIVTATATVIQVLKTSDTRVHQGSKIAMKFTKTSCGPWARNGNEGTIIAKVGTDSKGRLVLCPYTRKFMRKGSATPPMSECLSGQ